MSEVPMSEVPGTTEDELEAPPVASVAPEAAAEPEAAAPVAVADATPPVEVAPGEAGPVDGTAPAAPVPAGPAEVTMRVWRGDQTGGEFADYTLPAQEGEVVLDVIHRVQATEAPDLACRWNCKAGKCGSCSAEINGKPRLMCMTRMDQLPEGPVTVAPMRTFPILRDLVTDVSFNYEMAKQVPAFQPGPEPPGGYRMLQIDVERGQEFRKCIECFMCQDVCHVIRDHEENKTRYAGPRFFIRYAELEMHPLDTNDRRELVRQKAGLGMCNITKCCTEVCPEHIKITDNAIIPMKERVVDSSYDPVGWLGRKIMRRHKASPEEAARTVSEGALGNGSPQESFGAASPEEAAAGNQ